MKKIVLSLTAVALAFLCCQAHDNTDPDAALTAPDGAGISAGTGESIRQLVISGNEYFDAGDIDKARDCCCRAFSLMKESSDASLLESCFTISNSLFTIARIYRKNGDPDKALEYLDRSLDYEKALDRTTLINRRYEEKIEILVEEHRYNDAMATILESRKYIASNKKDIHYASKSHYMEGLCKEAIGDMAGAEASIEKAVELADEIYLNSNHVDIPTFLNRLARYSVAKGDTATAIARYRRAEKVIDTYGNKSLNEAVCSGLAELYAESDPGLSAEYRQKAQVFDYIPELEALASKIAIDSIDFPRREREQYIRNQKMKILAISCIALLMLMFILLLLQRYLNVRKLSEARKVQNESLMQSLQQKNRLLELAKEIQDQHLSDQVRNIADQIGTAGLNLTNREKEIAALIAEGLMNKEIAYKLHLSVRTVENHRLSLYRKLGVTNSVELIKCLGPHLK